MEGGVGGGVVFYLLSLSLVVTKYRSGRVRSVAPPDGRMRLSPRRLLDVECGDSPRLDRARMFGLLAAFRDDRLGGGTRSHVAFRPGVFRVGRGCCLSGGGTSTEGVRDARRRVPVCGVRFASRANAKVTIISKSEETPRVLTCVSGVGRGRSSLCADPGTLLR